MFHKGNYTLWEKFLWNFYILDVDKVYVKDETQVPDYLAEMTEVFLILFAVENIGLYLRGMPLVRLNDGITSISTGMMMICFKILPLGIEFYGYNFLYQYRYFDPDWSSLWTWWTAALLVDFSYYWIHRFSHEVNFLWALGHSVHHSSEYYNLTTSMRQPGFLSYLNYGLYHPLALLGAPFPAILAHVQFKLIYQFWIHTELIGNLGPLEHVLNTPSHHRVHHGMNNWCLDKNYGSVFIIWDKIFGTFQAEKKEEKIIYGLVSQPQTFEPIHLQTFYAKDVVKNALRMGSVTNFLKGIFYGPAWYPGAPRLGDEPDMTAKVTGRKKYDPTLPLHITAYVIVHFTIIVLIHQKYVDDFKTYIWISIILFSSFTFWTLSIIGSLLDGDYSVGRMEVIRCLLATAFLNRYVMFNYGYIDMGIFLCLVFSAVFWLYNSPPEPKEKAVTEDIK